MEKQNNVPKLRFPEFVKNGEWEKKKFGEVSTFINGRAYKQEELLDNGKYRVLRVGNFFTNNNWYYSDLELEDDKYCDDGDLLYAWSASFGPRIWKGEKVIYHYHIWKVQPNECIFKDFLFVLLDNETERMKTQNANGFALLHITKGTIENWKCCIPKIKEEQTRIASFFTAIDQKLQYLKKKKTLLERYKKGVMQKIFSREISFRDEQGNEFPEWEEKKLGEVCQIKRGASPRPITSSIWFNEESKIGWVRISDVTRSNKFLEKTEQYLSEEGIKKSRLVKKGNMIMSICASIGKPIYTNIDVCIHDGFIVFEDLSLDKEYLFYYLDFIQLNWYKYGQPGTQVNLNSEIVSNEIIPVPSFREQTKIASFLSAIDEKINHTQTQIEKTEVWKKGLLQKMFV